MLEAGIKANQKEQQSSLFRGMAEPGTNPFEEAEARELKLKFVEFSVLDLLYQGFDWPGHDLLLEVVTNSDMSDEETLIFVGTGRKGEKHSDIVARALGIESAMAVFYRCQNAGTMKFKDGKWIVGGESFNLLDRAGREVYRIPYAEKAQMDSETAAKLSAIYGNERRFESGLVE